MIREKIMVKRGCRQASSLFRQTGAPLKSKPPHPGRRQSGGPYGDGEACRYNNQEFVENFGDLCIDNEKMKDMAPKDQDVAQYLDHKPKDLSADRTLMARRIFKVQRAYTGKRQRGNFPPEFFCIM